MSFESAVCFADGIEMKILDYYDGPISGVVTCLNCGLNYSFQMLDWTDDHRYRLFMLHDMSADEFNIFCSKTDAPNFHDSDAASSYELLKKMLAPQKMPKRIAVWDNLKDTLSEVAYSNVKPDWNWTPWMDNQTNPNWFARLNIQLNT